MRNLLLLFIQLHHPFPMCLLPWLFPLWCICFMDSQISSIQYRAQHMFNQWVLEESSSQWHYLSYTGRSLWFDKTSSHPAGTCGLGVTLLCTAGSTRANVKVSLYPDRQPFRWPLSWSVLCWWLTGMDRCGSRVSVHLLLMLCRLSKLMKFHDRRATTSFLVLFIFLASGLES